MERWLEYWRGAMDWKLDPDWECETCGKKDGLTWGRTPAMCRCNQCHTEYTMRNDDKQVVTTPICLLKTEYKLPAKSGWQKHRIPLSEWDDEMWDTLVAHQTN